MHFEMNPFIPVQSPAGFKPGYASQDGRGAVQFQSEIRDRGHSIVSFRKASDVKVRMACICETVDKLITRWHTLEI